MIFSRKEQAFIVTVFVTAGLVDSFNDLQDGAHWSHVITQLLVGSIILCGIVWVMRFRVRKMESSLKASDQRLEELKREAEQWKAQVAAFKPRLGEAIDQQFSLWGLTNAEKEIARLLLKGLSNREISTVRSCTEQTIKQQVNALYKKSGLASRAQLLAFFLEDLF